MARKKQNRSTQADVSAALATLGTESVMLRGFVHEEQVAQGRVRPECHPTLQPFKRTYECFDSPEFPAAWPWVLAMSGTKSRGEDARLIYEGIRDLRISLRLVGRGENGWMKDLDPELAVVLFGSAEMDEWPVQFSPFEADDRIETHVANFFRPGIKGAGTGKTSAELVVWMCANMTALDHFRKRKGRGKLFILTDTAPHDKVFAEQVLRITGKKLPSNRDVSFGKVMEGVNKMFDSYVIYPATSAKERAPAIRSELSELVKSRGGMVEGAGLRVSISWGRVLTKEQSQSKDAEATRHCDLDLHCQCPAGHIYFNNRNPQHWRNGGLDVDANGCNGLFDNPVENIAVPVGSVHEGDYDFWIERYADHGSSSGHDVPYHYEVYQNDQLVKEGNGVMKSRLFHGASRQVLFTVTMTGSGKDTTLAAYESDVVLGSWKKFVPESNILRAQPVEVPELMLAVAALTSCGLTPETFAADMTQRRVRKERRAAVMKAVEPLLQHGTFQSVAAEL